MITTFYAACRGDDIGAQRMLAFAERVKALGFHHLLDWAALITKAREQGYATDAAVPAEMRREHAELDWEASVSCHYFIYLVPHEKSEGAAGELTAAITARRLRGGAYPVTIVVGPVKMIFAQLADHVFETEDDAIGFLAKEARKRAILR